jgi:putative membrane protein
MPRLLLATASVMALLACAAPAWAQSNELSASGPIDPAANANPAAQLPSADQAFVEEAAKGGMAEVELGRLAPEKASDQEVKDLAQLIVREHEQANQQLKTVAQAKGVEQLGGLDAAHLQMRDQLQAMSGADFDRMYIEGQVADHEKAVALFEQQAQSGQDPELKAFAAETLPKIQAHTEQLEQVAQRLAASG